MKIIAVDDEPAAVELLADEIKTAVPGAQVISFQFPDDVMKYAKENSFDVAFLDIEMPQMDGHRLTRLIKSDSKFSHIPVVIFSSLVNEDMRRKGESIGADAQLSKPEIGQLVEQIDKLVR